MHGDERVEGNIRHGHMLAEGWRRRCPMRHRSGQAAGGGDAAMPRANSPAICSDGTGRLK
jgi:hypothetical protein